MTTHCEKQDLAFDFLRSTFGNNTEFYQTLLDNTGLLGSYLPLWQTSSYSDPQEFFSDQTIYILLTDFYARAKEQK